MLAWIEETVPSPYGSIRALNWAVGDAPRVEDSFEEPEYNCDEDIYGVSATEEVRAMADLDDAEDQLGAVLWNSNSVVLQYLHEHIFEAPKKPSRKGEADVEPQTTSTRIPISEARILELGSGVGALGIALAAGGAQVAVTDIKELVPLMKRNIRLNSELLRKSGGNCLAATWRWGEPMPKALKSYFEAEDDKYNKDGGVDVVVMCDALYGNPKDWPALIKVLNEVADASAPTRLVVLNFCEQRIDGVEDKFMELLQSGESLWKAVTTDIDEVSNLSMKVRVTRMTRRRFAKKATSTDAVDPAIAPVSSEAVETKRKRRREE